MKEYLDRAIENFGEEISERVYSLEQHHICILKKSEKFDEERRDIFHSMTTILLYLIKRALPDLELFLSFLSTWINKSDKYDWKI